MEKLTLQFQKKEQKQVQFYTELRTKVGIYFRERKLSSKANKSMIVKGLLLSLITWGAYFLILSNWFSPIMMLLLAIIFGIGVAGIGFCITHDAMHGAYAENVKINQLLSIYMDLLGTNTYLWHLKHNVSHHSFTNIHEYDEDIKGVKLIRFSPYAPYYTFHQYQHYYAFALYGLVYFNMVFVHNFKQFFLKDFGPFRNIKHTPKEWIRLFFWKIIFVIYTIVIPLWVLHVSIWQFLVGYITMGVVAGFILGLVFNLAHIVEETLFPLPNDDNQIQNIWAIHQLETTNNFAPGHPWLTWYLGGLNYQVEHHLFPHICSVHYPAISKIVKETARVYELPYHSHATLWQAIKSHYMMLKKLGQKEVSCCVIPEV